MTVIHARRKKKLGQNYNPKNKQIGLKKKILTYYNLPWVLREAALNHHLLFVVQLNSLS